MWAWKQHVVTAFDDGACTTCQRCGGRWPRPVASLRVPWRSVTEDFGSVNNGQQGIFWDVTAKQQLRVTTVWLQTAFSNGTVNLYSCAGSCWVDHATDPSSWTLRGSIQTARAYELTMLSLSPPILLEAGEKISLYAHSPSTAYVGFHVGGAVDDDSISATKGWYSASKEPFQAVHETTNDFPAAKLEVEEHMPPQNGTNCEGTPQPGANSILCCIDSSQFK